MNESPYVRYLECASCYFSKNLSLSLLFSPSLSIFISISRPLCFFYSLQSTLVIEIENTKQHTNRKNKYEQLLFLVLKFLLLFYKLRCTIFKKKTNFGKCHG